MFLAFGWAVIQSSQKIYVDIDSGSNGIDDKFEEFDEIVSKLNNKLITEMENWLIENASQQIWFEYKFTPYLNNHSGLFQFHTSRNHNCTFTRRCVDYIAKQSQGSYGLVHVRDDEALEFGMEVWKILDGKITKHKDDYFTPFQSPHAFGDTNFWMEQ